jgi:hypothetical protein
MWHAPQGNWFQAVSVMQHELVAWNCRDDILNVMGFSNFTLVYIVVD